MHYGLERPLLLDFMANVKGYFNKVSLLDKKHNGRSLTISSPLPLSQYPRVFPKTFSFLNCPSFLFPFWREIITEARSDLGRMRSINGVSRQRKGAVSKQASEQASKGLKVPENKRPSFFSFGRAFK